MTTMYDFAMGLAALGAVAWAVAWPTAMLHLEYRSVKYELQYYKYIRLCQTNYPLAKVQRDELAAREHRTAEQSAFLEVMDALLDLYAPNSKGRQE